MTTPSQSPVIPRRFGVVLVVLLLAVLVAVALAPLGDTRSTATPQPPAGNPPPVNPLPAATYATGVPAGYPAPPTVAPVTAYPGPGETATAAATQVSATEPPTPAPTTLPPSQAPSLTPTGTITATFTPPPPPPPLALAPAAATTLWANADYQEMLATGSKVVRIVPVDNVTATPDLVIFYAKPVYDKGGQVVPKPGYISIRLLRSVGSAYQDAWDIDTEFDSGRRYYSCESDWWQERLEVIDVTDDGQPEVLIAGCIGLGGRCYYASQIWDVAGNTLFSSPPLRFAGLQLLPDERTIVTLYGLDFSGTSEADLHPTRWQLDYYRWDGSAFVQTRSETTPYSGATCGPAILRGP